jgi:prepilin-type N-terminal cleavage/methylation domain-containing protein
MVGESMVRESRAHGFTLVELIVAMFVLAILTVQMFALFTSQHKLFMNHEDTVEVQEDSRLATAFVLSDLRMAGYMVPRSAAIASRDGGTGGSDVFCASDSTIINDSTLATAGGHFNRASLTADVDASKNKVTVAAGDLDIDGDGDVDFIEGRGVIIGDGAVSHCATITNVNTGSGQITFTPATPAGFSAPIPGVRAVPARIYQLNGSALQRDGTTLSTLVEDVQVEFGVDSDGNGQLDGGEFPIHDLNGFDPALVRQVRLTLITRVPVEDPDLRGSGRPAAANRTAGAADGFRRRAFVATAFPRNLE